MTKPSQVIILVEDNRHQQLILRYLRRVGLELHAMRFVPSPPGTGSGEQWVREQFAQEVAAYRSRRAHAETKLICRHRRGHTQPSGAPGANGPGVQDASVRGLDINTEQVARLIPKRNVETWILGLNEVQVDEVTDYKRTHNDWAALIRTAAVTLFEWTRPNARIPASCVDSLQHGIRELSRLDFRAS
jgi:hypothetical protein